MAVSGTTAFDLDIVELIEEAYEQAGIEARTGYDMRTARRSLDLLFIEWGNKGYNLWTIEEGSQALTASDGSYQLDADLIDLVEFVIRTSDDRDTSLSRVPLALHANRNNKTQEGRPNQIYVDRQRTGPIVNLWPLPDTSEYTLVYWALRRINDAGNFTNTVDTPFRFLPAVTAGLAHKLAGKKKPGDTGLITRLKVEAEQLFKEATEEDRDRSDVQVFPEFRC